MNLRLITVGLTLLCFSQVWAKPAEKSDDSDYQEDDGQDDRGNDYEENVSSGPITAVSMNETIFALPGTSVTLPCKFQNADSVAIEWRILPSKDLFLDEIKLNNDDRMNLVRNNKSLVIDRLTVDDTAEYSCQAMSTPPVRIVHKLFVTPEGTRVKVLPNEENDIEQGTSITITCQAGEDLKPTAMHWNHQGRRVHSEHSQMNGQVRAISLTINDATRHNAGDYQCMVDIGAANPIVKHLKLHVNHKPEVEYDSEMDGAHKRPLSYYVTALGANVNITCVVHAHPGVTALHWIHNQTKIIPDGIRYFKSDLQRSHHVLAIKNVTKDDLGDYRCHAYNVRGDMMGPTITLSDSPSQPRFSSGEAVDDAIVFNWKVISYNRVTDAEFLYRKEGDGDDMWQQGHVKLQEGIGKENIIVTQLRKIPPGWYEAKLRARNSKNGEWGPFSEIKKFDGEYGRPEASTGKGSATALSTSSFLSMVFLIAPLAYACL